MLTYIVAAFGLAVVLLLWGINQQLQGLREGIMKINDELQWDKKQAFAHDLREWLEEIPKDIVGELQWHKDSTFAHDLRERLGEISKSVAEEIQTAAKAISKTLADIEGNTSHD